MNAAVSEESRRQGRVSRLFRCRCGRPLFFRNSQCIACGAELGYDPDRGFLGAIEPAGGDLWRFEEEHEERYRRCANREKAACNWVIDGKDSPDLCRSCRLTRTIPDLALAGNQEKWVRVELAKRRVLSSLLRLGLPAASKVSEDPAQGLAFDLLSSQGGHQVMTGHEQGVVTLNVDEAQDVQREQVREQMGEPYRTMLGHVRHESGHYYWDRILAGGPRMDAFRQLFGDERADYGSALQRHYREGPPPDWPTRYVSAYASSHPWEDWAETWAHYLHIADLTDTAVSFQIDPGQVPMAIDCFQDNVLFEPDPGGREFLDWLNGWVALTATLNEFARSMGDRELYPFALPVAAATKLHFVDLLIREWRQGRA